MNANQIHINLSNVLTCISNLTLTIMNARSQNYDLNLKLSINGVKVRQVDNIQLLGVIINDKLPWDAQIEHLENKLISTSFLWNT